MLERNRLQPPRPSAPLPTAGGLDSYGSGCGGLFASAEDYDATGILAGVDPCESRYWWMPELYAAPSDAARFDASLAMSGDSAVASLTPSDAKAAVEPHDGGITRSGPLERLLRTGQAARRTPSRSTAAA